MRGVKLTNKGDRSFPPRMKNFGSLKKMGNNLEEKITDILLVQIVKLTLNPSVPGLLPLGMNLRVWKISPLETGLINASLSSIEIEVKSVGVMEKIWSKLRGDKEDQIFL